LPLRQVLPLLQESKSGKESNESKVCADGHSSTIRDISATSLWSAFKTDMRAVVGGQSCTLGSNSNMVDTAAEIITSRRQGSSVINVLKGGASSHAGCGARILFIFTSANTLNDGAEEIAIGSTVISTSGSVRAVKLGITLGSPDMVATASKVVGGSSNGSSSSKRERSIVWHSVVGDVTWLRNVLVDGQALLEVGGEISTASGDQIVAEIIK